MNLSEHGFSRAFVRCFAAFVVAFVGNLLEAMPANAFSGTCVAVSPAVNALTLADGCRQYCEGAGCASYSVNRLAYTQGARDGWLVCNIGFRQADGSIRVVVINENPAAVGGAAYCACPDGAIGAVGFPRFSGRFA
jgi:hypothetical protein